MTDYKRRFDLEVIDLGNVHAILASDSNAERGVEDRLKERYNLNLSNEGGHWAGPIQKILERE